ncbi:glutathione S-transferase family protein [Phenylobacterium conjunctum]|uniref:Glutathione S-transferase family protein n=1 Tax=Phenylobacterium conjunctum TaxID=1298959 RepID=A0ABW3T766_9CAUL
MSNDLVLYTHPMSRGRVARWLLEEIGQPYRAELLEYGTTMKGADYLAINPMGKVPALRHGDTIVTESAAICAYLADAFPQAGLAPAPTSPARGAYYRWLFFAAAPMENAMVTRNFGLNTTGDQQRMAGWGSYDLAVDTLEKAVAGREFLAGDRFSAADLYVAGLLGWGLSTGGLPPRQAFQDFAGRHASRPAAVRARELDDKLLAA